MVLIFVISISLVGCGAYADNLPERLAPTPVVEIGTNHNPAECGTISGQVTWVGELPVVPTMVVNTKDGPKLAPNPHVPQIHAVLKRLAGAVVFLRGIDPAKAKPWTRPNRATVEVNDLGTTILDSGRIGFVRHGDPVLFTSLVDWPQVVRGRGAVNFAIPLPSQLEPSLRIANRPGRIELTSGSNVAHAIAHLFVCEHPYYTIASANGEFQFDSVPAGGYELVVWHPNWKIVGHDRNPETGLIGRYRYGEAWEVVLPVTVKTGEQTVVRVDFPNR